MEDFDIILGMDWLGINHATIRCHEKEVLFHKPGKEEFCFFGARFKSLPRIVSVLQEENMLRNESCQGFFVNIIGSTHTKQPLMISMFCKTLQMYSQKICQAFHKIGK